ncbi:acyl-CoA thioesterase [Kribbella qitaiheensis]|uniref:Acyl-CoA thioesterase n=1 Tax=Kribbella qitaiheensis TaxID=1544730 RepID=A0A7G6WY75_9ACTN|nr:acyl-CoA thioester hydrolase/BAAT C-terminal domain-containing protein [Kribbella qitaiheensis]QNE18940.1 acyl-CoA thioesterase [Kribbella qitaiheensis]
MSTGILLLHGSSGIPDLDRARILQAEGYDVLAPKWFDERVSEIPLESFPLDELAARNDRLVVMGSSFGAEAALLLGTVDDRIEVVVGFAPAAHVWAWSENGVQTSHWSWQGEPLPFVPFDTGWRPTDDPPSYVDGYRHHLKMFPAEAAAARIPAERFKGDLLLMAGGDDKVWPSVEFAEQIALRRGSLETRAMIGAQAGHRFVFPGEEPKTGGQAMARGGSDQADRAFGARAWPVLLEVLAG